MVNDSTVCSICTLDFTSRIKKGYPYEARGIARVLPAFLADFFPAQDIMNKVIGEFLSSQQPYPQLVAKVVFQVNISHKHPLTLNCNIP